MISDTEGSLARTFFSPAHKLAAAQIQSWMEGAGMTSWIDAVGNVHGVVNGSDPAAPALLLGSHYDTVLDGGNYDGALGIIVGISAVKAALVRALDASGKGHLLVSGAREGGDDEVVVPATPEVHALLSQPVHVVAFTDEEGVRFQSTFLGSRALAGTLLKYNMLASKDKSGASLAEVLTSEGGVTDPAAAVSQLALTPQQVAEYVEVHMEQGPVLERRRLPLGVVSAIAGQTRLWLTINGTQGHAGTVPMRGRGDSLAAAAEVISLIERRCGGGPGADAPGAAGVMEAGSDQMLVCTVGEVRVWPGASNVIPGQTQLSIDIRSKGDALRAAVVDNVTASIEAVCAARGVACRLARNHDAAAVLSDDAIVKGFVSAIQASQQLLAPLGCLDGADGSADAAGGSQDAEAQQCAWSSSGGDAAEGDVPVMVSGAGHDAMAMAEITKMGMMFVRCRGGISHSPLEYVAPADVAAATAALTAYLEARTRPGAAA